jgi:26S proteasome regulatory subunit N5
VRFLLFFQIAHVCNRIYAQGSDLKSTTRLVQAIVELEYDARDYVQLNSSINVLSKKHGQLKGAIQAMVELAISWLDDIKERDGTEKWLELIETLRSVTEGKVRRAFAASARIL